MDFIFKLIDIYIAIIAIRFVVSWLNPDPNITSVRLLHQVTDPFLDRIRNVLPLVGSWDFSPVVGIIALLLLKEILRYIF